MKTEEAIREGLVTRIKAAKREKAHHERRSNEHAKRAKYFKSELRKLEEDINQSHDREAIRLSEAEPWDQGV